MSSNSISVFQKLDDLIKTHTDKKHIIILGSAPSVRGINFKNKNAYYIATGDLPFRLRKSRNIDLWVTSNTEFPNIWDNKHLKMIQKTSVKKILLSTICMNNGPTNVNLIKKRLELVNDNKIFFYDQRHDNGLECSPNFNCCQIRNILNIDYNIQEFLKTKVSSNFKSYSQGSTVALHALAIALCMKPEKIQIAGIELPSTNKDYKYIRHFAKIERSFIQNLSYQYQKQKYRKNNLNNYSPFGGGEEITLKEDFILLFKIARILKIQISVLSESKKLNSYLDESLL